jgi:hypothetical protein
MRSMPRMCPSTFFNRSNAFEFFIFFYLTPSPMGGG